MKPFRKTLLLLSALAGVSLFPGCGGSTDDTGNQFVSVSSFKGGSVGFMIMGSPIVRIRSNGSPNDVNPGFNPFPQIGKLDDYLDKVSMNTDGSAAEEWQNFAGDQADLTEADQSCWVNVSIYNSSDNQYSIDGTASYAVAGKMGYMELNFDEVSGSSNNLEYAALIHFMGAVTRSDLTYSTDGDGTDTSGANSSAVERIIITSLTGSTIKFWFNFESNQCLTELNYVAQVKQNSDNETTLPRMIGVWRITHPFLRLY